MKMPSIRESRHISHDIQCLHLYFVESNSPNCFSRARSREVWIRTAEVDRIWARRAQATTISATTSVKSTWINIRHTMAHSPIDQRRESKRRSGEQKATYTRMAWNCRFGTSSIRYLWKLGLEIAHVVLTSVCQNSDEIPWRTHQVRRIENFCKSTEQVCTNVWRLFIWGNTLRFFGFFLVATELGLDTARFGGFESKDALTAEQYKTFTGKLLDIFGKFYENAVWLMEDNCAVNRAFERKVFSRCIGGFCHPFNLAVQDLIGTFDEDIVNTTQTKFQKHMNIVPSKKTPPIHNTESSFKQQNEIKVDIADVSATSTNSRIASSSEDWWHEEHLLSSCQHRSF